MCFFKTRPQGSLSQISDLGLSCYVMSKTGNCLPFFEM